jgi:hypothetical protein
LPIDAIKQYVYATCNTQTLDLWTRSDLLHKRTFTQSTKRTNFLHSVTQAIVILSFPKFPGLGLTTPDFIHKLGIAQKETNETFYWLERLKETDYLDQSLQHETTEIIKSSKKNY